MLFSKKAPLQMKLGPGSAGVLAGQYLATSLSGYAAPGTSLPVAGLAAGASNPTYGDSR